jgi:hypothetical protein
MKLIHTLRSPGPTWLLLLTLALSGSVLAEPYDFEIVIFERPGAAGELNLTAADPPERSMAATVLETDVLPAESEALGPTVYTLKRQGMVVHKHVAWRQVPGGRNSQTWRWVASGRLEGLVRVTRGRYLHLDADLVLADAGSDTPHRIQLSRRFRSDELHYIDHPKVGILIQANRYEGEDATGGDADPMSGEPKPAEPGGAAG